MDALDLQLKAQLLKDLTLAFLRILVMQKDHAKVHLPLHTFLPTLIAQRFDQ